jgi:hypothetical protein
VPTLDELVAAIGSGDGPVLPSAGLSPPTGDVGPLQPARPANFTKLTNKWTEFSPFADQFPADVISALIDYDAERLARGSQPLTREQTVKAAVAARDRTEVTKPPERSISPLSIPGNALADLGTIITSLPSLPGAVLNEVRDIPTIPSAISEAQAEGANPISAIASAPGIRLLPGAYILENLTDPAKLAQHPLFTVLDILPIAAAGAASTKIGKVAATRAAKTGVPANPLREVLVNRLDDQGAVTRTRLGKGVDALKLDTVPGRFLTQAFGRDSREAMRLFEGEGARLQGLMNGSIKPADGFEQFLVDATELGTKHGLSVDEINAATRAGQFDELSGLSGQQLAYLEDSRRLAQEQGFRMTQLEELHALDVDGRVEFYPREVGQRIVDARDSAAFSNRMMRVREEMLVPSGRLTLDDFEAGLRSAVDEPRPSWAGVEARAVFQTMDAYGYTVLGKGSIRSTLVKDGPQAALDRFQAMRAAGEFDTPAVRLTSDEIITELRRYKHDKMADRLAIAVADGNTTRITETLDRLARRKKFQLPVPDNFVDSVRSLRDRRKYDQKQMSRYDQTRSDRLAVRAEKLVSKQAPARFEPLVGRAARKQFEERVMPGASPAQAAEITRLSLEERWPELAELSGREVEEVARLRDEVIRGAESTWREMRDAGLDPVFVHKVSTAGQRQVAYPRIGPVPGTYTQARERFLSWGEPKGNLSVSLTHQALEVLQKRGTEDALVQVIEAHGIPESTLRTQFADVARDRASRTNLTFDEALRDHMGKRYEKFNPDTQGYHWGGSRLDPFRVGKGETYWIPKPLAENLHRMAAPKGQVSQVFDPVTKTFRMAVIGLSPRTHLYNIMGGNVMLFGQAGVRGFANLSKAWKMTPTAKDPTRALAIPDEIVRGELGGQARHFTDAEFARAEASTRLGRTMARILDETPVGRTSAKWVNKSLEINGVFDDMYRVAAYLTGRDKALTKGMSTEAAEAAGRELMRKTMMDWTGMTPIERGIFKSVFPFYGFMSHALRYVSRYPVDHPLRAQVVAAFGRAEVEDLGGLPPSFLSAIWIGDPDSNRNALQLRGVNPFSDVGNLYTVAGFAAATNPMITTALEQIGIERGDLELYPTLRYDPETGQLAAQQQHPLLAFVENVIPQAQIATSLMGINAEFRERTRANPAAARRSLASAAGIPVVWRNYNVTAEIAKAEVNRQRSEDMVKSAALESGDWTEAMRHPGLRDYFAQLQQLPPEILAAFEPQDREQVADQILVTLGGTP